jgi:type IX secretion system PorP/SprF family membrane protein
MEIVVVHNRFLWFRILKVFMKIDVQKLTLIVFVTLIFISKSQITVSQQLPSFSQYTFNSFLLNPAVAGAEGYTAVNTASKIQWAGVEGAPITGNISIQGRVSKGTHNNKKTSAKKKYVRSREKVGLAAGIYYDRAGLIDQTNIFFTYAYHITARRSQLSLGATLSIIQFRVNTNLLNDVEQQNNIIGESKLLVYLPDLNLGAYYTNKNMFIGLSVLQLAQGSVHFKNYSGTNNNFVIYRHLYLTGGFKYILNNQNAVEPSFFVKVSEEWKMQMDATLRYIYNDSYWIGLAYRTRSTYIISLGLKVEKLYFGYAFDYGRKGVISKSYGSHELMVAYKFGGNVNRYKYLNRY